MCVCVCVCACVSVSMWVCVSVSMWVCVWVQTVIVVTMNVSAFWSATPCSQLGIKQYSSCESKVSSLNVNTGVFVSVLTVSYHRHWNSTFILQFHNYVLWTSKMLLATVFTCSEYKCTVALYCDCEHRIYQRNFPAEAGFLCDKSAVNGDTIKGTPCINSKLTSL